jgi:hypothetical protein
MQRRIPPKVPRQIAKLWDTRQFTYDLLAGTGGLVNRNSHLEASVSGAALETAAANW